MSDIAQLDYAANPRRQRWRRMSLRLFLTAALVCFGMWSYRFAQQLNYCYRQQQCMNWIMPPTVCVCRVDAPVDPTKAAAVSRMGWDKTSFTSMTTGWFDGQLSACVFLHGCRASGGNRRLVTVAAHIPLRPGTCTMEAGSWIPATLNVGSRLDRTLSDVSELLIPIGDTLRLFAGQPDPADESHFTIQYELNGRSGLIDGWLMADDSVKLEPRDGPLRR